VLEGLRGEESIAEFCRREGIVQNLYYRWSKDFLEAGKKRLAGALILDLLLNGRFKRRPIFHALGVVDHSISWRESWSCGPRLFEENAKARLARRIRSAWLWSRVAKLPAYAVLDFYKKTKWREMAAKAI
jgi:hypothetical protein